MSDLDLDRDPTAPLLELEGIVKDYVDGVTTRVLHGVDLSVARGELVALVGPSGAGKSTLLNILGLLERPTGGRLRVLGVDTATLGDRELTAFRGRTIGFVFQFHHLLPAFTAQENVMMPILAHRGRVDRDMKERAHALLAQVGLTDFAKRKANKLSGGQQQRVAVARALAMAPPLVLADEPTGNLDTTTAQQVFDLLLRCNRDLGTALLVVTHDERLAARCDRTVELVDGRIRSDERHPRPPAAAPAPPPAG
jgi:lipoprotein-releasing system ATP-binding protein